MRLRYWIKEALKISGIIMVASLVYTLLMMGWDAADTWRYYLNMGAMYLGIFGAFMSMVLGTSIYQIDVPLAISFGSTRKEVLWGIQCYRFVITFLLLLVAGILRAIAKEEVWIAMPIGICAFLVFNGMGVILGGLSNKLGKKSLVVLALVMMFLFFGVIAAIVLLVHFGFEMRADIFLPLMLGGSVLVYSLCMVNEVKTIRKFSVK